MSKNRMIQDTRSKIQDNRSSAIMNRASWIVNRVRGMKGFTLIEVISILIIVGVLAAIATTRFTGTSTISVRAAAEMIQADIRYTQETAMTKNATKNINFVAGATSYVVGSEVKELASGVIITVGRLFTFDSLGEPTAGGGQSVSVSDGMNTRIITVVNYTGKVSIS